MASNKRARATFEGQSSDRIAESDVAEETMSATVKLAKEIDEPDIGQPTAECQLMTPSERRLVTRCELRPVQGGEEDTEERVMTSHTETCESCEVTSVEEGHDVDGRNVPQSDETAGMLKQLKDEMSADLTAFKKGLDRKTNHDDLTKAETEEIFVFDQSHRREGNRGFETGAKCEGGGAEATTLERQVQQRQRVWCGLHPRAWSTRLQAKKGEEIRPLHAYCTQYRCR